MADSLDSGSSVQYARAGSSPASRTKRNESRLGSFLFHFFFSCCKTSATCARSPAPGRCPGAGPVPRRCGSVPPGRHGALPAGVLPEEDADIKGGQLPRRTLLHLAMGLLRLHHRTKAPHGGKSLGRQLLVQEMLHLLEKSIRLTNGISPTQAALCRRPCSTRFG